MTAKQLLVATAIGTAMLGGSGSAFAGKAINREAAAKAEADCRPGSRCYQRLLDEQDIGQRAYRDARRAAREIGRSTRNAPDYQGYVDTNVPQFRRGDRFYVSPTLR